MDLCQSILKPLRGVPLMRRKQLQTVTCFIATQFCSKKRSLFISVADPSSLNHYSTDPPLILREKIFESNTVPGSAESTGSRDLTREGRRMFVASVSGLRGGEGHHASTWNVLSRLHLIHLSCESWGCLTSRTCFSIQTPPGGEKRNILVNESEKVQFSARKQNVNGCLVQFEVSTLHFTRTVAEHLTASFPTKWWHTCWEGPIKISA